MTGRLSKNFHGVGIGPLSKILAIKEKDLNINDFDSRLERQLKSEYHWVNSVTLRTLQKLQHFWCQKNQNILLEPLLM